MTFVNAFLNPNKTFVDIVERFDDSLDTLWSSCSDNLLPAEIPDFDEHRDPIEALAEAAVDKEVMKSKDYVSEEMDESQRVVQEIVGKKAPVKKEDEAA
jgi:hypothetical protein